MLGLDLVCYLLVKWLYKFGTEGWGRGALSNGIGNPYNFFYLFVRDENLYRRHVESFVGLSQGGRESNNGGKGGSSGREG